MTSLMGTIGVRFRVLLLSKVVTRVIKAPSIELSPRDVPDPEIVMVPTRHGAVRCYVTGPPSAPPGGGGGAPPVHINIHGGAFIVGAPRQDDHVVRCIAGEIGAVVVNIDYSTAPSARFPKAVEECSDVFAWVIDQSASHPWDNERVSIGGGSAGATLALGVLQLAREAGRPLPRAAVLVVPAVDQTLEPESYGGDGRAFVSPALVRTINWAYFDDDAQRADPLASPGLGDLQGLPPLLVIAAERDSLTPQIERFVDKAAEASVSVTYQCLHGVDHDFPLGRSAGDKPHVLSMLEAIRDHLRAHLIA